MRIDREIPAIVHVRPTSFANPVRVDAIAKRVRTSELSDSVAWPLPIRPIAAVDTLRHQHGSRIRVKERPELSDRDSMVQSIVEDQCSAGKQLAKHPNFFVCRLRHSFSQQNEKNRFGETVIKTEITY